MIPTGPPRVSRQSNFDDLKNQDEKTLDHKWIVQNISNIFNYTIHQMTKVVSEPYELRITKKFRFQHCQKKHEEQRMHDINNSQYAIL